MTGKKNLVAGLFTMGAFMVYGFILIYLRDFAPGAAEWAANYASGKHFESRLAHVHGNLFGFLNILLGYLLIKLDIKPARKAFVSWTALLGLLMPMGIVLELALGAPPIFVLIGALSMTVSLVMLGAWIVVSPQALKKL